MAAAIWAAFAPRSVNCRELRGKKLSAPSRSITPEAHEAARQAGLNDNQSALLKIASYADEDVILRLANGLAGRET